MQADHIGLAQHLVECRVAGTERSCALAVGEEHTHAERLGELADALAAMPRPDDAKRRAVEIHDRMQFRIEGRRAAPAAGVYVAPIRHEIAAQRQYQREGMLGHRDRRIAGAHDDADAARAARFQIEVIDPGGGHADQFEFGQLVERFA